MGPPRDNPGRTAVKQLAGPAAFAAAFAATTRAAVGIIAELNHHHIDVMMVFGPVIADEDHQSSCSSVQLSLNLFRARGHPAAT
jgi:DNA-binding LacI/PurR family transcriptional regulator